MPQKEFEQVAWNAAVADDCRQIVRLGIREDLERGIDVTTLALIPSGWQGKAALVTRKPGVIAGLAAVPLVLEEMEIKAHWRPHVEDGDRVADRVAVAELTAPARDLLTAERLLLNLVGRLSGIATLTRQYVDAVAGTDARIYDTRKTTPGWRRLEKYAVRCGGGRNHRCGLFDAVLIKDNHLFVAGRAGIAHALTPFQAVEQARKFVAEQFPDRSAGMMIEVEVDTLDQFREVLPARPDIVLLDNMNAAQIREAVHIRNSGGWQSQLEASGGMHLKTIREVAEAGVERISVGALTHSAASLDIGLDWLE